MSHSLPVSLNQPAHGMAETENFAHSVTPSESLRETPIVTFSRTSKYPFSFFPVWTGQASLKPEAWLSTPSPIKTKSMSVKIATYNIWFEGGPSASLRHDALLSLLSSTLADVICLQEVTVAFLKFVLPTKQAKERWIFTDITGATFQGGSWYGTVILVDKRKWTVLDARLVHFPTKMGRALVIVTIKNADGQLIRVGSSHFESTESYAATRKQQLSLAYSFFNTALPSIPSFVCGDTNLCMDDEQSLPTEIGFRDAWLDVMGDAPGYTRGVTYTSKKKSRRLDRILFLPGKGVKTVTAETIGTEAVGTDMVGQLVYPSDHYGVVAEFLIDG